MARFLLIGLLLVVLSGLASVSGALAADPAVISGGDLQHPVRLAQADDDALLRRIDLPARLRETTGTGRSYTIRSTYWNTVLQNGNPDRPEAEADASYYPQGGLVRARQGGQDVWLLLDLRQRAILDRYIRLTESSAPGVPALSEQPGAFEVLRTAGLRGEKMGVAVGSSDLTEAEVASFWLLSVGAMYQPGTQSAAPEPGSTSIDSAWVTVTLQEGRSLQFLYTPATNRMIDLTGTEMYTVPSRWLVPVLGEEAAPQPGQPLSIGATPIEQDDGKGSPAWWPLLLGIGLVSIAAGWYVYRHPRLLEKVPFLGQ